MKLGDVILKSELPRFDSVVFNVPGISVSVDMHTTGILYDAVQNIPVNKVSISRQLMWHTLTIDCEYEAYNNFSIAIHKYRKGVTPSGRTVSKTFMVNIGKRILRLTNEQSFVRYFDPVFDLLRPLNSVHHVYPHGCSIDPDLEYNNSFARKFDDIKEDIIETLKKPGKMSINVESGDIDSSMFIFFEDVSSIFLQHEIGLSPLSD